MGLVPECDICGKRIVLAPEGEDVEYCSECNAWHKGMKTSIWADASLKMEEAVAKRKKELGGNNA